MASYNDFIVELGTEELPPLSLEKLARAFHDQLLSLIDDAGLQHQQSYYCATPRRLTVIVNQLAEAQIDKTIDRQGPAVSAAFDQDGNPTPAASGFAKSCNVSVEQLNQVETPKGPRLSFQINQQGKSAELLLPALVESALTKLPIARAMRWGNNSYSFIRPVKWLLMLQGEKVIPCKLFNCAASNLSQGHRFLSPGYFTIPCAADYLELLEQHFVIADIDKRKTIIREQILTLANKLKATATINPALLDEVTALVEWPVALAGDFDQEFLLVPQEALISTMATNQKYFHLQDEQQQLVSKFITIANVKSHNPEVIIAGNERVIRPRLADAKFFYDQDRKQSLSSRSKKLDSVLFQQQLGSVLDKTIRIQSLATSIAKTVDIDTTNIEQAARICKSDLLTDMVGEFPSLQGIMGRYYALNDGENEEVAQAMDEIYMPRFAGDRLPSTETGLYLALADRLDTLTGIFATGQIPTGNKDPFALRRATLGILRLIIENNLPFDLTELIDFAADNYTTISVTEECKKQILDFFAARLKAMYLDNSYSSTVIQSVLSLSITKPLDIDARIKAVKLFNEMEQAQSLAAANKRVANILSKNAADLDINTIDSALLTEKAEVLLHQAIEDIAPKIKTYCELQQYSEALKQLADLKPVIDDFFDAVMVMDENMQLRQNRLALLNKLRNLFIAIADISCLQK